MQCLDIQRRPRLQRPTLRLLRLRKEDHKLIRSHTPSFWASHWHASRSFPCLRGLGLDCPWCRTSDPRHHAYIVVLTSTPTGRWLNVLEAPPAPLLMAIDHGLKPSLDCRMLHAVRRSDRASPTITIDDEVLPISANSPKPSPDDIVRCLAKVYNLPEPDDYVTNNEWLLAVQLRTSDPQYTPARRKDWSPN